MTLLPPNINNYNYVLAYIIGYIDGDGCICTYLQKKKYPYIEVSVVGTKELTGWIYKFVKNKMKIGNVRPSRQVRKDKNYFVFKMYGRSACCFVERAIKLRTPKLERKWLKYEKEKGLLQSIGR